MEQTTSKSELGEGMPGLDADTLGPDEGVLMSSELVAQHFSAPQCSDKSFEPDSGI